MILDDALLSPGAKLILGTGDYKRLTAARYKMRRFVFDEAASEAAGRFATECADLVCEHSQFAIPPYPNTYIEIDQIAALRVSSRREIEPDTARRLGFLFLESGDLYVVSGKEGSHADFSPFRYHIKGETEGNSERDLLLRRFMIGEVADDLMPKVDEFAHRLTDVWDFTSTTKLDPMLSRIMESECRGQLKRAIAAVLLLNQKREIHFVDMPASRKIVKGKLRSYMAHSVVTINLGGRTVRRAFHIDNRASPRRHEVMGHFVHYGIDEACSHEWEDAVDDETSRRDLERVGRVIPRWRCVNCGGMRVHKAAHHRGDASKGFVTKRYDVKGG